MKKAILGLIFLLCGMLGFGERPGPIAALRWYYENGGAILNGKHFYNVAESYREQEGWATFLGRAASFWLYDTISYHNGNSDDIYNKYIPRWIEEMGYVTSFESLNVQWLKEDDFRFSSIKALMNQRGCDVCVCFAGGTVPLMLIVEYFKSKSSLKLTTYDLLPQR